jgi:ADP-ribose pyrophosphatase YjhB (NUDIX family)
MKQHQINIRVRLIVIKDGKLLVQFRKKQNFYHYIGGHLEYGETIKEACIRETKEECGNDVQFEFQKILYIRDFINPKEESGHSLELFILGDINKTEGLEKLLDPQHPDGSIWLTWLDIDNLPDNLLPKTLSAKLIKDFKDGFPQQGEYIGQIV